MEHFFWPELKYGRNLPLVSCGDEIWVVCGLEFRDTFRSIIHDNNSISSVKKFHYLMASLESDASLIIKSLEISSANYEVTWNALLERYDNNKLRIHNHIKALALEQLKQSVKEWDAVLVYIISTKLDNVTLREWEIAKADLESPKFHDIKHFLNSRADKLEMVAQSSLEKRRGDNTAKCVAAEHVTSVTKNIIRCCTVDCASQKESVQNRNDNAEKASEATTISGKSSVTLSACGSVDYVLLSTAYVQVTAPDGSAHIIRALLDCGAQSSFVTKDLIKLLKVNTISVDITVRGLNNVPSNIFSKCEMNIQSLYNNCY
ncbi:hypothetical protein NQ318_021882 [Aromia moschata]|uniref:Peptidase aspartic putative domain-containing protein n=1 Tax=Aromia moschata TaxID=1265417 RepID=A0AAV8Z809_9CUCU|nr:hypothetical protein NQ318_021882 [Aromia moschata]